MKNKFKNSWDIFWQIILIIVITATLLDVTLGLVFRIKDRKLIDAETQDHPYLYFLLEQDEDYRNQDGLKIFAAKEKPINTYRIITTGGSVVYGQDIDNCIASKLENILKDSFPNQNFEVLNAGVPAYVIEQEFILIQLVLQYYQANMIISLDGYNDLITCEINRYYPSGDLLPPHNWRDFRYVSQQKNKRTIFSRVYGIFPNIYRLKDFFYRQIFDKKYNYSTLSNNKTLIAQTYLRRVEDINAFCNAKGIRYHHFLQPTRFMKSPTNERETSLMKTYMCINDSLKQVEYTSSLLGIFCSNSNIYTDECHVNSAGNLLFAKHIFETISPLVKEDLDASKNPVSTIDSIQ